jgi:hypothetical protein
LEYVHDVPVAATFMRFIWASQFPILAAIIHSFYPMSSHSVVHTYSMVVG